MIALVSRICTVPNKPYIRAAAHHQCACRTNHLPGTLKLAHSARDSRAPIAYNELEIRQVLQLTRCPAPCTERTCRTLVSVASPLSALIRLAPEAIDACLRSTISASLGRTTATQRALREKV